MSKTIKNPFPSNSPYNFLPLMNITKNRTGYLPNRQQSFEWEVQSNTINSTQIPTYSSAQLSQFFSKENDYLFWKPDQKVPAKSNTTCGNRPKTNNFPEPLHETKYETLNLFWKPVQKVPAKPKTTSGNHPKTNYFNKPLHETKAFCTRKSRMICSLNDPVTDDPSAVTMPPISTMVLVGFFARNLATSIPLVMTRKWWQCARWRAR